MKIKLWSLNKETENGLMTNRFRGPKKKGILELEGVQESGKHGGSFLHVVVHTKHNLK